MRMRVGEKLVKNGIHVSAQHTGDTLALAFQDVIRGCGVPFKIYETSIHGKNQVAFSSLTGRNWRKLLIAVGPAIKTSSGVFPEAIRDKLASLFINFNATLQFAGKCERTDADQVAAQTNAFITDYVAMGFSITPYLHIYHLHLPKSIALHGGQDRFSGELLEAQNDAIKKTHLRRTDRKHPKLTLQTQLRIELQERKCELDALAAKSRKRTQRQQHPWQAVGVRERENRKRRHDEQEQQEATLAQQSPYDNLSVEELKQRIQAKGKKTKKQKPEKLRDILWSLEQGAEDEDEDGLQEALEKAQEEMEDIQEEEAVDEGDHILIDDE